jgi:hypothetical protein
VFVGALSGDQDRDSVLLQNYRNRKPGADLGLGRLVLNDAFKGTTILEAQERVQSRARKIGYPPTPLRELATEVNLVRASAFKDRENAVYVPLIGRSDATSSRADLKLKPHNYAQVIVKPEMVNPAYLAKFFNSPLGHAVRDAAASGVMIPKISRDSLQAAVVYIPPLEVQTKTAEAQTKIHNLGNELQELQSRLWSEPRKIDSTIRTIDRFTKEERFTDWLDTLPFPLASILWTYHTAGDDQKRRYEHLLHFFEALAEFMATVLLSVAVADDELFAAEREKLQKTLTKQKLEIKRSTFGTWKCIYEQLAKTVRVLAASPAGATRVAGLVNTHDEDVLQMLTSSELVAVIQRTNGFRNSWLGHSGVVGEREAAQRHVTLRAELMKVRDAFRTSWDRYTLVLPGKSIFAGGIYRYTVQRIVGRCAPFEHVEAELAQPLEHGNLHLLGSEERTALHLIPFVRVMCSPSTAENACYFYNREQEDGVRFVSYHFEQEADVVNQFPDTSAMLQQLVGEA